MPVIASILSRRRFTVLSPTLVRLEFSPDGVFEDRRSMVAHSAQQALPFAATSGDGEWSVLDSGFMEIRSRADAKAFDRTNLEIRWRDGRVTQYWRPGDRDYQNLGGTLRSLDRYGGPSCALEGVHPATMDTPDTHADNWPSWLICEVDPLYEPLHENPPEGFNKGSWSDRAELAHNDGRCVERTWNWYKDARKFCPGVLSRSGYFFLNDSTSAVLDEDGFPVERDRPGYQDWYFFAYASDYRQALSDFRLLTGPAPLPTHKGMGIVFSRWPAFAESEIHEMVAIFAEQGYPLSTLVMDMEWHKEGWGHWEIDPALIPDPRRFFGMCRDYQLEVVFNDHPLDVREDDCHYDAYLAAAGPRVEIRERSYHKRMVKMAKVDICDKDQNRAFLATCHQHILDTGLDYWWNDGSRGQLGGTNGQLVCNKTFFESSERDGLRGMLLGRYGGLGSHRYGVYFTGDTHSDWHVLRLQVEFNIRAAGVGMGHISHDIGGFTVGRDGRTTNAAGTTIIDPILYLRWLQFGVFNSILRFHCAPGSGSRLPYDYDAEVGGACRHWLRVRHSLLPYIYTAAWTYRQTGLPPTRGMYLAYPEVDSAYRFDQYFFGPHILVAPVVDGSGRTRVHLPEGGWWEFETGICHAGGSDLERDVAVADYPVYVAAGSILPRRDPDGDLHAGHIAKLTLDIYTGADGSAELYEDDGRSDAYLSGVHCLTCFTLTNTEETITVEARTGSGRPLGATRCITIDISTTHPPGCATAAGECQAPEALAVPGRYRYRFATPLDASGFTISIRKSPAAR